VLCDDIISLKTAMIASPTLKKPFRSRFLLSIHQSHDTIQIKIFLSKPTTILGSSFSEIAAKAAKVYEATAASHGFIFPIFRISISAIPIEV